MDVLVTGTDSNKPCEFEDEVEPLAELGFYTGFFLENCGWMVGAL